MPQDLKDAEQFTLKDYNIASILYHDIFDYPLTESDLHRWKVGKGLALNINPKIIFSRGYYFLKGKRKVLAQRQIRERVAKKKMKRARKAANLLSFVPMIRMIAITGSLAMRNASIDSDIDLMIITGKGFLWITRALSWFLLKIFGFKIRKPGLKKEKDMLCLNIWLDEGDLVWSKRNIFTAHEIAQIIPLLDRDMTYEKFIKKNIWIKGFWPNVLPYGQIELRVKTIKLREKMKGRKMLPFIIYGFRFLFQFIELAAYRLQKLYMGSKITNEIISPTRALFHPKDWSHDVLFKLKQYSNRN